jgi:hypothetical protein
VSRDGSNRGAAGFIDLDPQEPTRVLAVSDMPVLAPGPLGTFDDRGISIGSILQYNNQLWMYYMGWNKSVDVPFRNAIGLAWSADAEGRTFTKAFEGPLLDRSRFDPFTMSYPYVVPPGPNVDRWTMYYGTSRAGGLREEEMAHILTAAESNDGIDWRPTGREVVSLEAGEYGLARPWIWKHDGKVWLFYSIRRATYSIGVSRFDVDTNRFLRVSNNLFGSSPDDWDNHASCYPALIAAGGRILMFYNGNGYGQSGVGVAEVLFN